MWLKVTSGDLNWLYLITLWIPSDFRWLQVIASDGSLYCEFRENVLNSSGFRVTLSDSVWLKVTTTDWTFIAGD